MTRIFTLLILSCAIAHLQMHAFRPHGADGLEVNVYPGGDMLFENDSTSILTINGFAAADGVFENNSFTILEDTHLDFCAGFSNNTDIYALNTASSAAQGAIVDLSNNCFRYLPNPNSNGVDVLQVIFCNATATCDTAIIILHVLPVNDLPVAVNDEASTNDQTPVVLNVLSNDYDIDNTPVLISGILDEGHGEIVLNNDGTLTYIPALGFCGIDVVTYTIADSNANNAYDEAHVFITVSPADIDNDQLPDAFEGLWLDTDNDGHFNYEDTDADGDGIPDNVEAQFLSLDLCSVQVTDTDSDGLEDYLDIDSDNDGIADNIEAGLNPFIPTDTDGDGLADYRDLDSDNDGISDSIEGTTDTDEDGIPDFLDIDSDNDGVLDQDESLEDGDESIPNPTETNTDSIEIIIPEGFSPDGDGIADTWEIKNLIDQYPSARVEIYNRWGNRVYSEVGYTNNWRGNSNQGGQGELPSGTYYYNINFNDAHKKPAQGFVYLSRK